MMETRIEKFTGTFEELVGLYVKGEEIFQLDAGHRYQIPDDIKVKDLKSYYDSGVYIDVKVEWHEDLGKGILCWVSHKTGRKTIARVVIKNSSPTLHNFVTDYSHGYEFAVPLTKEEAMEYVWSDE